MPVETLRPIKIEEPEQKEFGREEAEEMAREFLEKRFDCFKRVWRASEYDDKKQAVDLIAEFENGDRLAIQFTITDDPERQEKKVRQVLSLGAIELHNDEGQIIDERKTPLVMIFEDKVSWGEAYNRYLGEGGENPLEYLPNQAETKKDFLNDMIISLKAQAMKHPGKKQIFLSRMEILEEELEEHKKLYKELVDQEML